MNGYELAAPSGGGLEFHNFPRSGYANGDLEIASAVILRSEPIVGRRSNYFAVAEDLVIFVGAGEGHAVTATALRWT